MLSCSHHIKGSRCLREAWPRCPCFHRSSSKVLIARPAQCASSSPQPQASTRVASVDEDAYQLRKGPNEAVPGAPHDQPAQSRPTSQEEHSKQGSTGSSTREQQPPPLPSGLQGGGLETSDQPGPRYPPASHASQAGSTGRAPLRRGQAPWQKASGPGPSLSAGSRKTRHPPVSIWQQLVDQTQGGANGKRSSSGGKKGRAHGSGRSSRHSGLQQRAAGVTSSISQATHPPPPSSAAGAPAPGAELHRTKHQPPHKGSGKRFAPVMKGDLSLPGGPTWSPLRRHIIAAGQDPGLPSLTCIILVEGDEDQRAVAWAVNAPVYVCDGTRVLKAHVRPELEALTTLERDLVVLTDPDERGRELRTYLDEAIGPLKHAFVPEVNATSKADGKVHAAGNRGIEHVVPEGVQTALCEATWSFRNRREFTAEELQERRLMNAFDAGVGVPDSEQGVAARRRRLCALLGLGSCRGKELLAALNRYTPRDRFERAWAAMEGYATAA